MFQKLILAGALLLCSFGQQHENTKQLSLSFSSKILQKGKYVSVEGEVYFKKNGGILTTHFTKPFENITIVNAMGELKVYDPRDNTLVQNFGALNSTETSYFWHFLNGSYSDMGLAKNGYLIKNTRVEDGLLITNWGPKPNSSVPIANVELVHEKNLPVFVGFKNNKNKFLGKIFFSSYLKAGDVSFPSRITEISYLEKGDSIVTTKTYTAPKINAAVNTFYLNYQVPFNAKIIAPKK